METEAVTPRWSDATCVVAATGPSLTKEQAELARGQHCIAVSDAYKLLPWSEALYSCDSRWWREHKGAPDFNGEKWTSYHHGRKEQLEVAKEYGLRVVLGKHADGFSTDPKLIHYGKNSGFQAINLAILFGATRILLIGFDMRLVEGKRHFFGDHPKALNPASNYKSWVTVFGYAADMLPKHLTIINCTPGSALKCFPMMDLSEALECEEAA